MVKLGMSPIKYIRNPKMILQLSVQENRSGSTFHASLRPRLDEDEIFTLSLGEKYCYDSSSILILKPESVTQHMS